MVGLQKIRKRKRPILHYNREVLWRRACRPFLRVDGLGLECGSLLNANGVLNFSTPFTCILHTAFPYIEVTTCLANKQTNVLLMPINLAMEVPHVGHCSLTSKWKQLQLKCSQDVSPDLRKTRFSYNGWNGQYTMHSSGLQIELFIQLIYSTLTSSKKEMAVNGPLTLPTCLKGHVPELNSWSTHTFVFILMKLHSEMPKALSEKT